MAHVRNTLELRRYNKKQVIKTLRDQKGLTKNDLASTLNLSLSTVGNICRDLLDEGIVTEEPTDWNSGGRSPRLVTLNAASRFIFCLDLTRHNEAVIRLSDLADNELALRTFDIEKVGFGDLIEQVRLTVADMLDKGRLPRANGIGMGVIIPGWYDHVSGKVLNTTNPTIGGSYLKQELESVLGIPVSMGNDANLGALALSRGSSGYIAFVYVWTGFGIGVAGNGSIFGGSRGFAAEMGHLPLGDPEIPCYCGNIGCLENILSLPGILRMHYGQVPSDQDELQMTALGKLIEAFKNDEPQAKAVIRRFGDHLGLAASIVVNTFDCETVYIGGITDAFFDDILPDVRAQFVKRVRYFDERHPQIVGLACTQRILFAGCAQIVFQDWVPREPVMREGSSQKTAASMAVDHGRDSSAARSLSE